VGKITQKYVFSMNYNKLIKSNYDSIQLRRYDNSHQALLFYRRGDWLERASFSQYTGNPELFFPTSGRGWGLAPKNFLWRAVPSQPPCSSMTVNLYNQCMFPGYNSLLVVHDSHGWGPWGGGTPYD